MAMKLGIGLLGGLMALALIAPTAWGQEMDFSSGADAEAEAETADDGADLDFSVEGEEGEVEESGEEAGAGAEAEAEDDLLGDIGGTEEADPLTTEESVSGEDTAALEPPEVWAVQRIYALRHRRFELVPRFGFSMNDQFVAHLSFGGLLNWYITDVLALGIEGMWFYGDNETDTNFNTARSFRVSIPINEYWMGWYLNFSYIPLYGKFAMFNKWIVHWDTFVIGGLGVTLTRPIPVVDSEFRTFDEISDWQPNITFSVGLGGRVFLTRWAAVFAELRMYGFPQQLESRSVAPLGNKCDSEDSCGSANWPYERANPETWLDPNKEFAINVMFQIGLSIFLPPTFEYRLPL